MGLSVSLGCTDANSVKGKTPPPAWIHAAQLPADAPPSAFSAHSPGMQLPALPNQVVRSRHGAYDTDAARWQHGYSHGKHVFLVTFPVAQRGVQASVGVGLEDAVLHQKGKVSLVGANSKTWGVSLPTRRALHRGSMMRRYPQTLTALPDTFYMYLDMDSGVLHFGADNDYYGVAHDALPRGTPLFPMVSATLTGATITIVYVGEAKGDAAYPVPPPVVY